MAPFDAASRRACRGVFVLIAILFLVLAFVFPIAVYFLMLALLNRRETPVLVSGPWDFLEVLFACSGFLLVGGPVMLTGFSQRWREYWLNMPRRRLPDFDDPWWHFWLFVWGIYFVLLVVFSLVVLWQRRRTTPIYNVEPDVLHSTLARVLDDLRLDWMRVDNRYFIADRDVILDPEALDESGPAASAHNLDGPNQPELRGQALGLSSERTITLELDVFPAMRHATLIWPGKPGMLRDAVEAQLDQRFSRIRTRDNPAGLWLLSIAASLFTITFFLILLLALLVFMLHFTPKGHRPTAHRPLLAVPYAARALKAGGAASAASNNALASRSTSSFSSRTCRS
jgi:hypothetical protein